METLVIFKSTVNLKKKRKLKSKVQEFSRLFESRRLKCLNKICRQNDSKCPWFDSDPVGSNDEATTTIICVLAVMVIILLLLFAFYFVFKFGRKRSGSKKYSPKGADLENIQPVQVKLLGYETAEKPANPQQSWNADLLAVSRLSDEEKHVNLLSKEFDKTNCVKFDDGIY